MRTHHTTSSGPRPSGPRAALVQIGRAGDEDQVKEAVEILTETRKRLYSILAEAD